MRVITRTRRMGTLSSKTNGTDDAEYLHRNDPPVTVDHDDGNGNYTCMCTLRN